MFRLVCVIMLISTVHSWDSEELELFDLVEEINQNFYEVMQITQDADISEVKKAYRNLSKVLHPDKNASPDAEVKFRQLVSIYEVLKDEKRRAEYDRVLVEGLPDWRSPIYYYRRARKMAMIEISIILTVVISVAQYLMAWGSYIDRRHTLEEALLKKFKIKDKRKKKADEIDNLAALEHHLSGIKRPSWWNILPVQLIRLSIFIFSQGPRIVSETFKAIKEEKLRQAEEKRLMDEEARLIKEEEERRKERKANQKIRKKVAPTLDSYDGCILDGVDVPDKQIDKGEPVKPAVPNIPVITGGPWTDEDFSSLARLMAKYPGGTTERWERIANHMDRTVYEVTKMSHKVKTHLANRQALEEEISYEAKVKPKTKGGKLAKLEGDPKEASNAGADEMWSPIQQKALEKALKNNPKGTDQRWDKIANCVPDKNKEECMWRFKFLAEKIRKKKEEENKKELPIESCENTEHYEEMCLQNGGTLVENCNNMPLSNEDNAHVS